ncbi:DNA-directed RNA polymerases I and III subunit RPAC2 [Talaromyces pinophilus]|nr:DNA-directed RNA polymerases I and III subunit RPAC2 [Talaromyces pinophilus]
MPASVHEDQDQSMVDVDAHQENGEVIEVGENRITIVCTLPSNTERPPPKLAGATDTAASFQFKEEGHTLGNALRYVIMKKYSILLPYAIPMMKMMLTSQSPKVEFCGYTIPHPSEAKMNIRIQTYNGTTPIEALEKGLNDLMDLCDVVSDKFTVARDAFVAEQGNQMTA